jgi:hypothetical protein
VREAAQAAYNKIDPKKKKEKEKEKDEE